ncbi:hypothetical protein GOBAR_AA11863 [Gossypium barbadense]|uniref:Uncharacterized protein n=1 Tax=Gossypium barbadense TaxID=3634 RepID=A0A2P5XZS4_GOSBA|nr:hypothetical protein GOBAR_AA11863 [Gossypium barbadense]
MCVHIGGKTRNKIEGLLDTEGKWIVDSKVVGVVARDYSFLKSEASGNYKRILDQIPMCITPDVNLALENRVTGKELIEAFNQMDPRKALGIDVLLRLFYKEN